MTRLSCLGAAWLVASCVLVFACQTEERQRPSYDGSCSDTSCDGLTDGASTPGGGGGGSTGQGGESGQVSGRFEVFTSDDFVATIPYQGAGKVLGQAPGAVDWVEAEVETGLFTLDGVASGPQVWFLGRPSETPQFFDTFTLQDSTQDVVAVPLVSSTTIESIYSAVARDNPRADSAQVIVTVRDQTGAGISDVAVIVDGAEFTAYDGGGFWSSQLTETSSAGVVLAGNVPAAAAPGQQLRVELSGAVTRIFYVRGAANAVTVVRVVNGP
ncbi:MAG TPA: hypothetical protein VLC09_20480 [Polyangiaceae bacterium]|nr:hypothetical protein [Polyangiaceae bacterium]